MVYSLNAQKKNNCSVKLVHEKDTHNRTRAHICVNDGGAGDGDIYPK